MAADCSPADVFALLDDQYARSLLAATSQSPMTARELSDECEMSRATVYRRLNELESCGLLRTETVPDSDGHHRTRYEATLDELLVSLEDGSFEVSVTTRSTSAEFADAFTDLWEGL